MAHYVLSSRLPGEHRQTLSLTSHEVPQVQRAITGAIRAAGGLDASQISTMLHRIWVTPSLTEEGLREQLRDTLYTRAQWQHLVQEDRERERWEDEFWAAARAHDLATVDALLAQEQSLENLMEMRHLIYRHDMEVLELLVTQHLLDAYLQDLLYEAIYQKNLPLIDLFLAHGASLTDLDANTFLHILFEYDPSPEYLLALIARGYDFAQHRREIMETLNMRIVLMRDEEADMIEDILETIRAVDAAVPIEEEEELPPKPAR